MAGYSPLDWRRDSNTAYDGGEYHVVELAELPKSRAPSYVSTRSSVFRADDDEEALLSIRSRAPTYSEDPKDGEQTIRYEQEVSKPASRARRKRLQGWKFGVSLSAWTAFSVLFVNVVLTSYAGATFPLDDGIGSVMDGDCKRVNTSATWLHLLINALSSILLSASNYTMQCLSAPTRAEIDRAHARGRWLDIGVAGVRNLANISWPRVVLWWVLALSTVPIHLLYNSAVFKTLNANAYMVGVANAAFFEHGPNPNFSYATWPQPGMFSNSGSDTYNATFAGGKQDMIKLQDIFARDAAYNNRTAFEKLSNEECIAAYGRSYLTGRDHVIAVTSSKGKSLNQTLFYWDQIGSSSYTDTSPSYNWICTDDDPVYSRMFVCHPSAHRKNADNWTIGLHKIDYCLSRVQEPHCKLQFSTQIMAAVIVCNFLKAVAMFYTLYRQKDTTLVTVGDAVASYLDDPDETTRGRCLMAKVDAEQGPMRWSLRKSKQPYTTPRPTVYYAPLVRRWFGAASKWRWISTMGLCLISLASASALLSLGAYQVLSTGVGAFDLSFGAVDSRSMISTSLPQSGASGLVMSVLLSNLPQAILSFLYLMYNGLYTCMCLSHEWSKYAVQRKPLRVTTPRGQQMSTYYLQLPYYYGIPLIIASGTLHWLVSQSIFLARVSIYDDGREVTDAEISQVGYSNLAILLTIILGACMLLIAVGMGFRKFKSHIPVAGSCSVAIAAACHRPKDDVDAAYLPVSWGEVNAEGNSEVGHCCFTSEEVQDLIPGRAYAGYSTASAVVDGRDDVRKRSHNVQIGP